MNELQYKEWHDKSQKFHLLWFLFLGGIMVVGYAYGIGKEFTAQAAKYGLQALPLQATRLITRELLPVNVGLTLATLSPILGFFANYKLKQSTLANTAQKKILIHTRLKSLFIVTPFLLASGIILALLLAYFSTEYKNFTDLVNIKDYIESIVKAFLFTLALSLLAFVEIKFFFRESQVVRRIVVCVTAVIINSATILVVDLGVGRFLLT